MDSKKCEKCATCHTCGWVGITHDLKEGYK